VKIFRFLIASVLIPFLPAQSAPVFQIEPTGVRIEAGEMGRFDFGPPGLRRNKTDYSGEKPALELVEPNRLVARYASGAQVVMETAAGGSKLVCSYSGVPTGAPGFVVMMKIPISFKQGGKAGLGGGTSWNFPEAKEGQFVGQGTAERFSLVDPLGTGFSLKFAQDFVQIQDNRAFGWDVFMAIFNYTIATHPGKTSFAFELAAFDPSAAAEQPRKFLVDRFGQSARKDYPGKVRSDEELRADGAAQAAEQPKENPGRDAFGGWTGSGETLGLKKTGFFHVAEAGGRQTLVDPEGNAFFQLAVCGISSVDDHTLVKGRERTYEWLPDATGEFASAWREGRPDWGAMSFYAANWIRKFGRPFTLEEWTGQVVRRLRSWGFNSAGAFSVQTDAMREAQFPGVSILPLNRKSGLPMLPGNVGAAELMDPFAPDAESRMEAAFAEKVAPRANDPLLIGWFLGNEQHFESLPKLLPSYKGSQVAAKARLVEFLKAKYPDIDAFNRAWKPAKPFAAFSELSDEPLFVRSEEAAADMKSFYVLFLETYYSMVHRVFKKYDPNHLLIGSRWTPHTANNEDLVRTAGRWLDVVSVNYYSYAIEENFLRKIHDWSGGKPIILSEWYFSATDHGLGSPKEVRDQKERGLAYRNYIEQAASLPFVVGSQWFIYTDQAITGRFFQGFNGEGNNTGFVDVADRPYPELVQAAALAHERIYDVMFGRTPAFALEDSRFNGKGGGGSGKVLSVVKVPEGFRLEGTASHWPGVPAEPIESSRIVVGAPSEKLRADYRAAWNKDALFLHIQIKDPTPMNNLRDDKALWGADGVELFVGSKDLEEGGTMAFSDRQILVGANEPARLNIVDHPEDAGRCQVSAVRDVTADGYVVELAIPWTVLGVEAEAGRELLFDLAINHSDDGVARTHQLVWNGTAKNSGDRAAWGRARLVEN
jgi:hypothetical protein